MHMRWAVIGVIFILFVTGAEAMAFTVSSDAFTDGSSIPARYSCDGSDISPPLRWSDAPSGTRSFVLIVEDPDAPVGTFIHWVVYDIPAIKDGLQEALPPRAELEDGTKQGRNDFGRIGYGGPCPPRGHGIHRYFFVLKAIDIPSTGLPPGASKEDVERAIEGHILGEAHIMGTYERR